jgi:hypothetical protein
MSDKLTLAEVQTLIALVEEEAMSDDEMRQLNFCYLRELVLIHEKLKQIEEEVRKCLDS